MHHEHQLHGHKNNKYTITLLGGPETTPEPTTARHMTPLPPPSPISPSTRRRGRCGSTCWRIAGGRGGEGVGRAGCNVVGSVLVSFPGRRNNNFMKSSFCGPNSDPRPDFCSKFRAGSELGLRSLPYGARTCRCFDVLVVDFP
jgi:hypothetical protein